MTDADTRTRLDRIETNLDGLRLDFDAVVRGLHELIGALGAQTEMLTAILEATTAELPESDLGEKLDRIADALESQDTAFQALDKTLAALPDEIAQTIGDAAAKAARC